MGVLPASCRNRWEDCSRQILRREVSSGIAPLFRGVGVLFFCTALGGKAGSLCRNCQTYRVQANASSSETVRKLEFKGAITEQFLAFVHLIRLGSRSKGLRSRLAWSFFFTSLAILSSAGIPNSHQMGRLLRFGYFCLGDCDGRFYLTK